MLSMISMISMLNMLSIFGNFSSTVTEGLKSCNFIKKRFQERCFPVNIAKFLRTAFFIEHLRGLLLSIVKIAKNWTNTESAR